MDRITCVQIYVNRLLDTLSDPETHRSAAVHLYGVAASLRICWPRRCADGFRTDSSYQCLLTSETVVYSNSAQPGDFPVRIARKPAV